MSEFQYYEFLAIDRTPIVILVIDYGMMSIKPIVEALSSLIKVERAS